MDVRVDRLKGLIARSVQRRVDIPSLARTVNLSPSRLSEIFRRNTGTSPKAYLLALRYARAAHLLRSTFTSIKEIAASIQVDESHFCRNFKRFYGMTPREYRLVHTMPEAGAAGDQLPSHAGIALVPARHRSQ